MVALERSDRPKVDLVLEGGGVKGIGLVGAVLTLSGSGYVLPRVAGTSAGAIVAALVAAHQVAGKPLSNIETIMASVDYNKFQDEAVLERLGGTPGQIAELLVYMGIPCGTVVRNNSWRPGCSGHRSASGTVGTTGHA